MPGNKAAIGQHYNAASDRYISHDGVVHALAKAAGVEANIVHYDTKAVSLAKVTPLSACRNIAPAFSGNFFLLLSPMAATMPERLSHNQCCAHAMREERMAPLFEAEHGGGGV